jgi:hypothetical protein
VPRALLVIQIADHCPRLSLVLEHARGTDERFVQSLERLDLTALFTPAKPADERAAAHFEDVGHSPNGG